MNYSNQSLTLESILIPAADLQQSSNSKLLDKQQRHDLLIKVLKSKSGKPTFADRIKNILVHKNNWRMTKPAGQRGVTFL